MTQGEDPVFHNVSFLCKQFNANKMPFKIEGLTIPYLFFRFLRQTPDPR